MAVKDARILNGFIWMVFIYAQTSMVKDEIMTKKNALFVMNYCLGSSYANSEKF